MLIADFLQKSTVCRRTK